MKERIILCAVCVLLCVSLMVWGFADRAEKQVSASVYYALMTEDRGTNAVQFRQGAQLAADEAGADLSFLVVSLNEEGTPQLLEFLETLSGEQFDGLILPACDESVYQAALALMDAKGIPLVCLWKAEETGVYSVATDPAERGAEIAESILRATTEMAPITVFAAQSAIHRQMLAGFESVLGGWEITVLPPDAVLPPLDERAIFVSFDSEMSEMLARSWGELVRVWGVDPGESRVELLERGLASGLSMEMPYIQGYLAVSCLKAEGGNRNAAISCPSRTITGDTMYLSENVKLVFPLIQ